MWLLFGVIALLVSLLAGWSLRRSAAWRGTAAQSAGRHYEWTRSSAKQVASWRLGIAATGTPEFLLKPQGALDSWFHRMGIHDEVQTGDARFDGAIYVASDHPSVRQALRFTPALRAAVLALVDAIRASGWNWMQLRAAGGRMWIQASASASTEVPDPDTILPLLADLHAHLPPVSAERRSDPYFVRAALLLAFSSALAISGLIVLAGVAVDKFPQLVERGGLVLTSVLVALPLGLGLILLALYKLGRSARSHYVLMELATIGMFGLWAWTFTGLREWNMRADASPLVQVLRPVSGHFTTTSRSKGRTRTRYHLVFPADPQQRLPELKLRVDNRLHSATALGSCFRFDLRQGALGWPWFVALQQIEAVPVAVQAEARRDCGN